MQAEVLGWRGRIGEALAVLDEADAASLCVETAYEASIAARVRGEILARAGDAAAADAAFARAAAAAMRAGADLHAAQAATAQARWACTGVE
jgi:predicted negative regulator of RcsB-dependent stress response